MDISDRADFQATSDPAVMEAADRGQSKLLSYAALYDLWERQQWSVQDTSACSSMRCSRAGTLVECGPAADGLLKPTWMEEGQEDAHVFGTTIEDTRAFAMKALDRRLKVIGLTPVA